MYIFLQTTVEVFNYFYGGDDRKQGGKMQTKKKQPTLEQIQTEDAAAHGQHLTAKSWRCLMKACLNKITPN